MIIQEKYKAPRKVEGITHLSLINDESSDTGNTVEYYSNENPIIAVAAPVASVKRNLVKSNEDTTNGDETSSNDCSLEDLDIGMYDTAEVDSGTYRKILENSLSFDIKKDKNQVTYFIAKTKNAYVFSRSKNSFTWLCSGFDLIKKVRNRDGEVSVVLKRNDDLGDSNVTVPYSYFQKTALKELGRYGITISAGCEDLASMYFTKQINNMKTVSAEQQIGFFESESEIQFNGYSEGILKASMTFASFMDYIEALNELITESVAIQYLLAASMSSALMTILNIVHNMDLKSYCINVVGRSSTGKTLSCKLCASVWSDPKEDNVFTAMLSTPNAFYKRLSGRFGVPIMLDEATIAEKKHTDEFAYTIYEQKEKQRLNPDCSIKTSGTWNTIVLMTSEKHFHSDNNKRDGGVVVRIHNADDMTYTVDREHADKIENFISENYGVLGRKFVKTLIANKECLKDYYEKSVTDVRSVMSDNLNDYTERLIKYYALTHSTCRLLKKLGLDIDLAGVTSIMCKQNSVIGNEYNMAENAMNAIKSYLVQYPNDNRFKYAHDSITKNIKSVRITDKLTEFILEKAGYSDAKVTINELDRKGFLIRQGNGARNGKKSKLYIDGVKVSCYQFKMN